MAMIFNYATFHWLDQNGKRAENFLVTQNQSPGGESAYLPLASTAQALSVAALVAVQFTTTTILGTTPGSGDYPSVFDRAVLLGQIPATGRGARNSIPAPVSTIFLPGRQQIDLSNSLVTAHQSEVIALLGDSAGNPWGPFLSGIRATAAGS